MVSILTILSLIFTISASLLTKKEYSGFIHQIPNPNKYFTGRDKILSELEEKIFKSKINVLGVHGMGGIGKTELIIALANRVEKQFEAEFFIDIQGYSEIPVSSDEAMAHIVKSFLPMQSNLDKRSLIKGAYQSILNEKKILIVLDNVRDETQIKDLAPKDSSVLLYTSRIIFSLSEGFQKELPVMSEDDSIELLAKVSPRISAQEGKQIAELCGYLPLALLKVGRGVSKYENLSVQEYISKLADVKNRVGLIDSSTNLSYNLLNKRLKSAWRKLSVFQFDFGEEIASLVLQASREQTLEMLEELLKLSLLHPNIVQPSVPNEFDIAEFRYKFHELDRLFAKSKIKTKEQKYVEISIVEYYSNVLRTLAVYFARGGNDFLVALSGFDREWTNINHAQHIAKKYSKTNRRAADLCVQICLEAVQFLDIRLPKEMIVDWSQTALTISRRVKNFGTQIASLNNLGTAYSDMGQTSKGIPLLHEAIDIARKKNMQERIIDPLDNLATAYRRQGDTENSLKYHFESYELSKENNNTRAIPGTLLNIGNSYRDLGEMEKAIQYHTMGLESARKQNLKVEEIYCLLNLAIDNNITRKIVLSVKNSLTALSLSRKYRVQRLESAALVGLWELFRTFFLSYSARIRYFRKVTTFSNARK